MFRADGLGERAVAFARRTWLVPHALVVAAVCIAEQRVVFRAGFRRATKVGAVLYLLSLLLPFATMFQIDWR
jgi:hypothetical protein